MQESLRGAVAEGLVGPHRVNRPLALANCSSMKRYGNMVGWGCSLTVDEATQTELRVLPYAGLSATEGFGS